MTKITLAISKCYKNEGKFRTHRKKTKKGWKHCFMSDDYTDGLAFGTEWVDSITAQFLKLKKWHFRIFYCPECWQRFSRYIKYSWARPECPYCEEEEE